MMIIAVLSTGYSSPKSYPGYDSALCAGRWIGESVVRISLDADTLETTKCQCCLRCAAKCIWCFGAAAHWMVLVLTYFLIIFAIVVVIIAVFLLIFVVLV